MLLLQPRQYRRAQLMTEFNECFSILLGRAANVVVLDLIALLSAAIQIVRITPAPIAEDQRQRVDGSDVRTLCLERSQDSEVRSH